ncbi:MAG: TetR/AcrR family transcriptional regulator, partial [Myxococcota bacterium]
MARSPNRSKGEGRQRILEVAAQSFAANGYAGTSLSQVARDAGVTQPLVHHHFSTKEGLWRAVVDEHLSDLPEVDAAFASIEDPREVVLELTKRFVYLSARRPTLARLVAREGASGGPRLDYLLEHYIGVRLRALEAGL